MGDQHLQLKTSRFTFTTSVRNTCNILLKHLKHVEHTLSTCTKTQTAPRVFSSLPRRPNVAGTAMSLVTHSRTGAAAGSQSGGRMACAGPVRLACPEQWRSTRAAASAPRFACWGAWSALEWLLAGGVVVDTPFFGS
jgi:hypothetical protein